MKREHAAAAVTVLLIVGVVAALAVRAPRGGSAGSAAKPSGVVFDLYQRAQEGDVQGYLECFAPEMRQTVESSRDDMGDAGFREHITAVGRSVKGVSISDERVAGSEARLRVELVYADRPHNDVQTFTVVRRGGRWLIASMSGAQAVKMPVPYGTPAYPLEQDGGEPGAGDGGQGTAADGEQPKADEPEGGG